MTVVIESVILIGVTTTLIVQTIRGKIPWTKIWENFSKQPTTPTLDNGNHSADQSQQWLDSQNRQQQQFHNYMNKYNNDQENRWRNQDNYSYATHGRYPR